MTTLTVIFDTSAFGKAEFDIIVQGGTLLTTTGLLNMKWSEFSALDAAREIGLYDVHWDAVRDDTPGTLTCVIRYEDISSTGLEARLLEPFIIDYNVSRAD